MIMVPSCLATLGRTFGARFQAAPELGSHLRGRPFNDSIGRPFGRSWKRNKAAASCRRRFFH